MSKSNKTPMSQNPPSISTVRASERHLLSSPAFDNPGTVDAIFDLLVEKHPEVSAWRAVGAAELRQRLPGLERCSPRQLAAPTGEAEQQSKLTRKGQWFKRVANLVAQGRECRRDNPRLAGYVETEWRAFATGNTYALYRTQGGPPADASDLHKALFELCELQPPTRLVWCLKYIKNQL